MSRLSRGLALTLPSLVFATAAAAQTASVTIKGTRLRTSNVTTLSYTLSGPGTNLALSGDVTRTLGTGTYQIAIPYAQPYGTFTVDSLGQVVSPTGSLTAAANVVDFDLGLLAKVTIAMQRLTSDVSKAGLVLEIAGITNLVRDNNPAFYLPPNLPGNSYQLRTAAGAADYGTFVVNPDLTLGTTTGSLIATTGAFGQQVDFDLTLLTGIVTPSTAALTDPPGVGAFSYHVGAGGVIPAGGATLYFPANGTPTASYLVSTWTAIGRFGSFRIEADGSVSSATGSLVFTEQSPRVWQMAFDLTKLARIDVRIESLEQPYLPSGIRVVVFNEVVWAPIQTTYLPPNAPGTKYQLVPDRASTASPQPSFGTLTVASDRTLTTTGAMRIGADGYTLSPDLCALDGIRIAAVPGRTWSIATTAGYYTRDISTAGNATDVFLPDGTYTVGFSNDGAITVTLAGGAITAASPGLSVAGGGVASASCDSTPPVLSLPADITVPPTSAAGAVVTYAATATDDVDPAPVVACSPASGSTFPIGMTSVSCTATDATGNSSSGSFNVTVVDQTPPVITVPGNLLVTGTSMSGAVVNYVVSATDAIDPAPAIACAPTPGSLFGYGVTPVACTATDASGNTASATFTVQVVYAFDGFKPPIANDGSSIFKLGRTIPVRFQLRASADVVGTATATIQVFRILTDVTGTHEVETEASGNSNVDDVFRYDPAAQQYVYNLNTGGYATGTYLVRANVGDGTIHDVRVSLR